MTAKLLFTPEEAAEALGICRTRIFYKINSGEIESVTIGRSRRISRRALEDYVARLERGEGTPAA